MTNKKVCEEILTPTSIIREYEDMQYQTLNEQFPTTEMAEKLGLDFYEYMDLSDEEKDDLIRKLIDSGRA